MITNQFKLGKRSKEVFISQKEAPLFERFNIRMAGITEACDEYLCARRQPDHHTLLFITGGQGQVNSNKQIVDLPNSSMVLLKKGVDFVYQQTSERWSLVWFIIEPSAMWQSLDDLPLWIGEGVDNHQLKHMLHLLALNIPIETRQLLNNDIHRAIQNSLANSQQPTSHSRLTQIFLEVEQQLHFPWSSQILAKKLHVSEATLHRMCKNLFQESPRQKIIGLRMSRTAFLLENSDWSLTAIAEQVGYKDAFSLSKMFKKVQGISPDSFRKIEK